MSETAIGRAVVDPAATLASDATVALPRHFYDGGVDTAALLPDGSAPHRGQTTTDYPFIVGMHPDAAAEMLERPLGSPHLDYALGVVGVENVTVTPFDRARGSRSILGVVTNTATEQRRGFMVDVARPNALLRVGAKLLRRPKPSAWLSVQFTYFD